MAREKTSPEQADQTSTEVDKPAWLVHPDPGPEHLPEFVGDDRADKRLWNDDELRAITNFDELLRAVADKGIATADLADFGSGYEVLESDRKMDLVGQRFAILDWHFTFSQDTGSEFVSMIVLMEKTNQRFIVNDGGTGIPDQLKRIQTANKGEKAVLFASRGLRVSEYSQPVLDKNAEPVIDPATNEPAVRRAKTFYLAI